MDGPEYRELRARAWLDGTLRLYWSVRYRLRQAPEEIVAQLRVRVESELTRLSVFSLGRRTRLRLVSEPRISVPAFEVGVVELYFERERELTLVRARSHQVWRWWTVSVRAPAGIFSVLIDMVGPGQGAGNGLTGIVNRAVDAAHERQVHNHERLRLLVIDYLTTQDVGMLGGDPFRR